MVNYDKVFILFLTCVVPLFYFGQRDSGGDTFYLKTKTDRIENFSNYVLRDFDFSKATFDYNNKFQPTLKYDIYGVFSGTSTWEKSARGKVKKTSKFLPKTAARPQYLREVTEFDEKGRKFRVVEYSSSKIVVSMTYDQHNRLSEYSRQVNDNEPQKTVYRYNENGQLADNPPVLIYKWDHLSRLTARRSFDPEGKLISLDTFTYNDNTVTEMQHYKGVHIATRLYTYCENYNMIRETVIIDVHKPAKMQERTDRFTSYNQYHFPTRIVFYKNGKFWYENMIEYNDKGDYIKSTRLWNNGHRETTIRDLKYDRFGNLTYELTKNETAKITSEYLYENEYY